MTIIPIWSFSHFDFDPSAVESYKSEISYCESFKSYRARDRNLRSILCLNGKCRGGNQGVLVRGRSAKGLQAR
jgi:hypothetical protein